MIAGADSTSKCDTWILVVIALVLVGIALKALAAVAVPVAMAFFLVLLVQPVHGWLKSVLPKWMEWAAVVGALLVLVAVLAAVGGVIWLGVDGVVEKWPAYEQRFSEFWPRMVTWFDRNNLPSPEEPVSLQEGMRHVLPILTAGLNSTWAVLGGLTLVFFLMILVLLENGAWRKRACAATGDRDEGGVVRVFGIVATNVRRYLVIRGVLSIISGVSAGVILWLLGVDFALLWGVLVAVLNILPYVGSVLATIPPVLLCLVQFGFWWAFLAALLLIASEQLIGNLVSPRLEGEALSVSPTILLVAIIFWGGMWGVMGAVLAVPLTATIIIVCANIDSFRPVALLLSRHANIDRVEDGR